MLGIYQKGFGQQKIFSHGHDGMDDEIVLYVEELIQGKYKKHAGKIDQNRGIDPKYIMIQDIFNRHFHQKMMKQIYAGWDEYEPREYHGVFLVHSNRLQVGGINYIEPSIKNYQKVKHRSVAELLMKKI